jgi:hypothetical protein
MATLMVMWAFYFAPNSQPSTSAFRATPTVHSSSDISGRIDLAAGRTRVRPIESIRVGDRVLADNPDVESSRRSQVDPSTWRRVHLQAETSWDDGTRDVIYVETLQPPEWLAAHRVRVGAMAPLPLDLQDMGLAAELRATVTAIYPCPPIRPGPGRVVLSTVNHLNRDVYELTLEDSAGHGETFRPTGLHQFHSQSRQKWVSTRELRIGERLSATAASAGLTVVAKTPIPGPHRVYNMTVEGEHVYHISTLGVLAHNNGCGTELAEKVRLPDDSFANVSEGKDLVIGKLDDLNRPNAVRPSERKLDWVDQGSPKANWEKNSELLRKAMREGKPIRDVSVDATTGDLKKARGFLQAERKLLEGRGWSFDKLSGSWHPPR